LLSHIREAFGEEDKLHTAILIQRLCNRDESPWMEANYGKPLTDRGLATKLKPYRIKSKPVRVGDVVLKGYTAGDFWDVWMRYLPSCHTPPYKGYESYKVDNEKNVTPATPVMGGMAEPGPEADLDDAKVAFEERAAIREFDAGLDRQEAEEAAAEDLWPELREFLHRKQSTEG